MYKPEYNDGNYAWGKVDLVVLKVPQIRSAYIRWLHSNTNVANRSDWRHGVRDTALNNIDIFIHNIDSSKVAYTILNIPHDTNMPESIKK